MRSDVARIDMAQLAQRRDIHYGFVISPCNGKASDSLKMVMKKQPVCYKNHIGNAFDFCTRAISPSDALAQEPSPPKTIEKKARKAIRAREVKECSHQSRPNPNLKPDEKLWCTPESKPFAGLASRLTSGYILKKIFLDSFSKKFLRTDNFCSDRPQIAKPGRKLDESGSSRSRKISSRRACGLCHR